MKRVCFCNRIAVCRNQKSQTDQGIADQLMAEGPVECWFYKCCRPFAVQALETILEIRKERPDAELAVVDVVDPLETETENMVWSEQEECDFFPAGTVDRFITAPVFTGKAGKNGGLYPPIGEKYITGCGNSATTLRRIITMISYKTLRNGSKEQQKRNRSS